MAINKVVMVTIASSIVMPYAMVYHSIEMANMTSALRDSRPGLENQKVMSETYPAFLQCNWMTCVS